MHKKKVLKMTIAVLRFKMPIFVTITRYLLIKSMIIKRQMKLSPSVFRSLFFFFLQPVLARHTATTRIKKELFRTLYVSVC